MEEKIASLLSEMEEVEFGYLFGSYAKGEATSRSDVDLALFLNNDDLDTRLSVAKVLGKALQKEIDLTVLNDLKNLYLLEKILEEGKVVKKSDKQDLYEVRKRHEILDYKHFKKMIDAA